MVYILLTHTLLADRDLEYLYKYVAVVFFLLNAEVYQHSTLGIVFYSSLASLAGIMKCN